MNDWRELARPAVLVVDDNEGVRRVLTRFIERDGYPVVSANGGKHQEEGEELGLESQPQPQARCVCNGASGHFTHPTG